MMLIDWLTEMTARPVCLLTRSAVRCRVPDSSVGIAGSGTSWTAARRILVQSLSTTMAPSIFASSRSRVELNSHVEHEAAGAQAVDHLVVAEHDQRAGAAAQDALEPVAQGGAGRDRGQRGAQRTVEALGDCHVPLPAYRCTTGVVGRRVYPRGTLTPDRRSGHETATTTS